MSEVREDTADQPICFCARARTAAGTPRPPGPSSLLCLRDYRPAGTRTLPSWCKNLATAEFFRGRRPTRRSRRSASWGWRLPAPSPAGTELCSSQVSLFFFVPATNQHSYFETVVQTRPEPRVFILEYSRFVFIDYWKIKMAMWRASCAMIRVYLSRLSN